jgi:leader peptidase (prepilin peptidase)/N-methyltransferase
VIAATAALFGRVALRFGLSPAALAYLWLAGAAVVLTVIDLRSRRLPNVIVAPSCVAMLGLLAAASAANGDWPALGRAGIGGLGLLAAYFGLAALSPNGMGMGDVKLAGLLGLSLAYLGWAEFAVGALAAFVLGGVFCLGVIAMRGGDRSAAIPFGPWMLAGAAIGIAFGPAIWAACPQLLAA